MNTKAHNKHKRNTALKTIFNKYEKKILIQEKEIFDLEQILEISHGLNSVLNFDRLIEALLYGIMAQLKTLGAAIFTKKNFDDDVFFLNRNYYGFDIDCGSLYSINSDHPIIKILQDEPYGLCRHEMYKKLQSDAVSDSIFKIGPSFFVLLKARNKVVGLLLLGKRIDKSRYNTYEKNIIAHIASIAAIAINNSLLFEMTTIDIMTNLKLKHYFYTMLSEKLENINNAAGPKDTVSVLMMDIDFFKRVNDTYGHTAGDIVLQEVARIIKECTRSGDTAARYGGEEFVMLLANANVNQAFDVAERIRSGVEQAEVLYEGQKIKIKISIGVASYMYDFESANALVERADKALYVSKESGRNRSTISEKNLPQRPKI